MNLVISLLTLAVALLTQVQANPQVSTTTRQEAFNVATLALNYAAQYEGTTTQSSVLLDNAGRSDNSTNNMDTASSVPVIPTTLAFTQEPTYSVYQHPGDIVDDITVTWQTNLPTTAQVQWCPRLTSSSCGIYSTVSTVASTTGTYILKNEPRGDNGAYQFTVTSADGQIATWIGWISY